MRSTRIRATEFVSGLRQQGSYAGVDKTTITVRGPRIIGGGFLQWWKLLKNGLGNLYNWHNVVVVYRVSSAAKLMHFEFSVVWQQRLTNRLGYRVSTDDLGLIAHAGFVAIENTLQTMAFDKNLDRLQQPGEDR